MILIGYSVDLSVLAIFFNFYQLNLFIHCCHHHRLKCYCLMSLRRNLLLTAHRQKQIMLVSKRMHAAYIHCVSKKTCDYIFCNNLNNKCPIIVIFGTLISETISHRMVVSFPTSPILCNCLTLGNVKS